MKYFFVSRDLAKSRLAGAWSAGQPHFPSNERCGCSTFDFWPGNTFSFGKTLEYFVMQKIRVSEYSFCELQPDERR